jgi:hypothetical protein
MCYIDSVTSNNSVNCKVVQVDYVEQSRVRELIAQSGHNIFGVTFVKVNGEVRNMTARVHVRMPKHAVWPQGIVDRAAQDEAAGTVTVFDMNKGAPRNKGAWRRFRIDSIIELRIKGQRYRPVERLK